MENKLFWTLSPDGTEILRDLSKEHENFTVDRFHNGEFDGNNFQWYEMFDFHSFNSNGCDYERMGCYIQEGDVVLDLGGNIGIFAHRAEMRGASKVYSFEPLTPTFNCLIKNAGPKTTVYKNAVGCENKFIDFRIHTDFTHIGGGTSEKQDHLLSGRNIIHAEKAFMIDINDVFEGLGVNVDFMKVDTEGSEVEILTHIKDEYLSGLRCLAAEFHNFNDSFEEFQTNFIIRMERLGFYHFTLYHGNGELRTITFWKK